MSSPKELAKARVINSCCAESKRCHNSTINPISIASQFHSEGEGLKKEFKRCAGSQQRYQSRCDRSRWIGTTSRSFHRQRCGCLRCWDSAQPLQSRARSSPDLRHSPPGLHCHWRWRLQLPSSCPSTTRAALRTHAACARPMAQHCSLPVPHEGCVNQGVSLT